MPNLASTEQFARAPRATQVLKTFTSTQAAQTPRWLQRPPASARHQLNPHPGTSHIPGPFARNHPARKNRILFLDGRSGDIPAVIAGCAGRLRIVLLDAHTDGIRQIAHHLNERHAVDEVLISTADETGCLSLGSTRVTVANLYAYEDELRRVGSALAQTGVIRLLGRGMRTDRSEGALLVMLSRLTGAEVAASRMPAHELSNWAVPWTEPAGLGSSRDARKVA
jgi:hypothetical protein